MGLRFACVVLFVTCFASAQTISLSVPADSGNMVEATVSNGSPRGYRLYDRLSVL